MKGLMEVETARIKTAEEAKADIAIKKEAVINATNAHHEAVLTLEAAEDDLAEIQDQLELARREREDEDVSETGDTAENS